MLHRRLTLRDMPRPTAHEPPRARAAAVTLGIVLVLTLLPPIALVGQATCPPDFSSAWWSQSPFATADPNTTLTATVSWQNVGCLAWNINQTGAQAFAGTWNPTPGQDQPSVLGGASNGTCGTGTNWWGCSRIRPTADIVNPGAVADFTFDVNAPPAPGTYQLFLRPVVEGVIWMEDQGVYWQMTVRTPQGPSRYMKTVDATSGGVIYKEGCIAGGDVASRYGGPYTPQTGVVVLDFGQPWFDASTGNYGSVLFNNSIVTTSQVLAAAEAWGQGYWDCSTTVPTIRIAVGTNNLPSFTNAAHGKAWGNMVSSFASWITANRFDSQLSAAGASDMELGYNTAANTRNWSCVMNAQGVCTDGFGSVSGSIYYNYGDAESCPPFGTCRTGWTQEDVWYDSWGSPPAWPLPEIYNDGTAQEWYRVSLYGYTQHGRAMTIKGAFTQRGACELKTGCIGGGTDYTPQQGWTGLWNYINKDSRTIQIGTGELRWSTDITSAN